jgi:hypothetical protein
MESATGRAFDANSGGSTIDNLQYALHGFSGANSNMAHSFGNPQGENGGGANAAARSAAGASRRRRAMDAR